MSTFRVLACLGALGLILQTPAGQAQSFLGSGPTERFSVPPVGDAMPVSYTHLRAHET